MNIVVKEVLTKQDLRRFVKFPYSLYAGDPHWVPPLLRDEMGVFDPKKNPAFKDCEVKCWLALKDGVPAGRIAGIISRPYIEKWKRRNARFGWLEFIDDPEVSSLLFRNFENWALEHRMSAAHGPLGFTDFDPEGMLVEGFDRMGTMQTIYNFVYYPRHLERLGYQKDVDWLEYDIAIPDNVPERVLKFSALIRKRFHVKALNASSSRQLLPYVQEIFGVLNEAYKDLYGVVPLSEEQVEVYKRQYFSFIEPAYVSVILDGAGRVAAFAIAIPSLSEALRRSGGKLFPFGFFHIYAALKKNNRADLFLVAVRPDMQGKGLNAVIIHDLVEKFIKNGIRLASTHPALENNNRVLALWKDYDAKFTRRRRCYTKELDKQADVTGRKG
jgi:GNAT superfamily N-acetyltransferase